MLLRSFVATALVLFGCFNAVPASAHFKLLKPASWLKEDSTGGPQKGSPCGPGGTGFLGDDVQPVPTSGMITEYKAGEEIDIELDETIPHQGYWRIAIAKDRSEFTIPPVDNPMSCALARPEQGSDRRARQHPRRRPLEGRDPAGRSEAEHEGQASERALREVHDPSDPGDEGPRTQQLLLLPLRRHQDRRGRIDRHGRSACSW
jgi:hypothetical protein